VRNTKPLAAVGFSWFDMTGNFSQFSGTFLVHLQHTCFLRNIFHSFITVETVDCFFTQCEKALAIDILLSEHKSHQAQQAANSLPLAREHLPDVNNKPISIPHLE